MIVDCGSDRRAFCHRHLIVTDAIFPGCCESVRVSGFRAGISQAHHEASEMLLVVYSLPHSAQQFSVSLLDCLIGWVKGN